MDIRPALLRFLILRGATPEEAEDVVQEISIRLATAPVAPVAQMRAYLYRMASNQFLINRRTADRRSRREVDWVDANTGDPPEIDERPSAEAGLIAADEVRVLQGVIDRLPERTRQIFRRFRLEGEPQRDIAEDLGISVSAVEKHLARAYEAVASIRKRLDGDRLPERHLRSGVDRYGI